MRVYDEEAAKQIFTASGTLGNTGMRRLVEPVSPEIRQKLCVLCLDRAEGESDFD